MSIAKIIFLLAIMSLGDDKKIVEKALSDFRDNSFFVSVMIKVKTLNTTKLYVVENDDLYRHLKKYEKLNVQTYAAMMRDKLIQGKILKLKELNSDFIEVLDTDSIDENVKKGKGHFIKTYFTETGVLRKGIDQKEKITIIQKLFEFNVLSSIDDESGYLCVDRDLFVE